MGRKLIFDVSGVLPHLPHSGHTGLLLRRGLTSMSSQRIDATHSPQSGFGVNE